MVNLFCSHKCRHLDFMHMTRKNDFQTCDMIQFLVVD